jgi:putative addiction module component (TIGR02574 family)
MATTQIREELHQFINIADERVLKLIYGMMKADHEDDISLTDTHKQLLDERLAYHKVSPHEGASWQEVKHRIQGKG